MILGSPQKVNETALYEPNCNDSCWFVAKQLLPVYGQLCKHVIFKMVPFVRARMQEPQVSDNTVTFARRRGLAECEKSLVNACAIGVYPDPDKHLPYVACTLKAGKPVKNAAKYSSANKMEAGKLMGCAFSQQRKAILQETGLRTMSLKPPVNYMPSVVIDSGFKKRQNYHF